MIVHRLLAETNLNVYKSTIRHVSLAWALLRWERIQLLTPRSIRKWLNQYTRLLSMHSVFVLCQLNNNFSFNSSLSIINSVYDGKHLIIWMARVLYLQANLYFIKFRKTRCQWTTKKIFILRRLWRLCSNIFVLSYVESPYDFFMIMKWSQVHFESWESCKIKINEYLSRQFSQRPLKRFDTLTKGFHLQEQNQTFICKIMFTCFYY